MPYYARGDYYAGDPGFFGALASAAKGIAKKFIPGPATVGMLKNTPVSMAGMPSMGGIGGAIGRVASSPIGRTILGGAASGVAGGIIGGMLGGGRGGARAGGFRSYRRMNVGNVRALRRSMRRVEGFAKLARSTMSFTTHHKIKPRGRRKK